MKMALFPLPSILFRNTLGVARPTRGVAHPAPSENITEAPIGATLMDLVPRNGQRGISAADNSLFDRENSFDPL